MGHGIRIDSGTMMQVLIVPLLAPMRLFQELHKHISISHHS
jgi:hypothetical protein